VTLGTHRAAACSALEGPDCVTTKHMPNVEARPGTVRVAVRAAGVNYPDYLLTRGQYQLELEPPFTPGMEFAGVIAECGHPPKGRRRGRSAHR
jgi:NADPH2:quinone reductase